MKANTLPYTIGTALALTLSTVAQAQTIHPGPIKGEHFSVDNDPRSPKPKPSIPDP